MGSATESIATANQTFMERFGAGDADGVGALYSEKGRLFPPGFAMLEGREAAAAFWKGAMGMGLAGVTLTTTEVEEIPTGAVETGTYVLTTADGTEVDDGKYLVVWQNNGGTWNLHRDIWNSSRS